MKLKTSVIVMLVIFNLVACAPATELIPANSPIPSSTVAPQNTTAPTDVADLDKIYEYAISPDYHIIAVSKIDGISLYDSATLNELRFINRQIPSYFHGTHLPIAFSPDGKYIAYSDGFSVYVLNLSSSEDTPEKKVTSLIPSFEITEITINQQNSHIILRTEGIHNSCDGIGVNYALYDLSKGLWGLVIDRYSCLFPSASHVRFTETGKVYFFVWYITELPYSMEVFDLSTNALIESNYFRDMGHPPEKTYYDISPDGKTLASIFDNNGKLATKLIDNETGAVKEEIDGVISLASYPTNKDVLWKENWVNQLTRNLPDGNPCRPVKNQIFRFDSKMYNNIILLENSATYFTYRSSQKTAIELWDIVDCKKLKVIDFGIN
ncbi:MAG: PD40 domain-containing protein [Chloroflexi bacterium]|nr:PD40 domain-containing protein [Chloroflexota bacterium]